MDHEKFPNVEKMPATLEDLWRKYSFPFEVPKANSPAENRLRTKAAEYITLITSKEAGQEENAVTADRLLDELAIMTFGGTPLESDQAKTLQDFIFELAKGHTPAEEPEEELLEAA